LLHHRLDLPNQRGERKRTSPRLASIVKRRILAATSSGLVAVVSLLENRLVFGLRSKLMDPEANTNARQETCKDVQHKKRGRPRLRDDREFSRAEEGRQAPQGGIPTSETFASQIPYTPSHPHRVSDPPRISNSAQGLDGANASSQASASNGNTARHVNSHSVVPLYGPGPNLAYHSLPVAFLDLDLVIQKSNQAFADLVAFLGDVRGKHLGDLLEARQNDSLQRLRNELRDERDEREPTYMPPITPIGQDPMRAVMESVSDRDVEHVSQAFTDRPMFLSFRLPTGGQYQSLQVQIRLAKTSLYFVTLVVHIPARLAAAAPPPPLLTQQLVPPTPIGLSQSRSAPTAPVTHFPQHQIRPHTSTGSAPNSPYFNFASVRTSLPTFSPGSFSSSQSFGYSPTAGPEAGYFPTIRRPSQPTTATYPSPYAPAPQKPSVASEPPRDLNRLHLPPIRTGPAPLGSPLHMETGQSALDRGHDRVRPGQSISSAESRRPETPEIGKRRRLNIHEMLE
jgi:hypothetical protein